MPIGPQSFCKQDTHDINLAALDYESAFSWKSIGMRTWHRSSPSHGVGNLLRDHFSPLDGAIQWDEIFAAFRDIDYKGWFMFEAAYPPGQRGEVDPDYVLDKVGAFPRGFIERYGRQSRKAI